MFNPESGPSPDERRPEESPNEPAQEQTEKSEEAAIESDPALVEAIAEASIADVELRDKLGEQIYRIYKEIEEGAMARIRPEIEHRFHQILDEAEGKPPEELYNQLRQSSKQMMIDVQRQFIRSVGQGVAENE